MPVTLPFLQLSVIDDVRRDIQGYVSYDLPFWVRSFHPETQSYFIPISPSISIFRDI